MWYEATFNATPYAFHVRLYNINHAVFNFRFKERRNPLIILIQVQYCRIEKGLRYIAISNCF